MKTLALIIFFVFLMAACTTQEPANVRVEQKTLGRDDSGIFMATLKLKNHGEQPAGFVMVIAEPVLQGNKIDRIEFSAGDIYPGKTKTIAIKFPAIGSIVPDDVFIEVVYNAYAQTNAVAYSLTY